MSYSNALANIKNEGLIWVKQMSIAVKDWAKKILKKNPEFLRRICQFIGTEILILMVYMCINLRVHNKTAIVENFTIFIKRSLKDVFKVAFTSGRKCLYFLVNYF